MALSVKSMALIGGGALTVTGVGFAANYLSKGTPMKQMLLAQGKKLIDIGEGYQDVFEVFKKDKELIEIVKTKNPDVSSASSKEVGGLALKEWCVERLDTYQSDSKTRKLMNMYCTKAPETIEEKLFKRGKKLVENWKTKLTSIDSSKDTKLLEEIKNGKTTPASLSADGAENALKDWCNTNKGKNLSEATDNDLENRVNDRCFN